MRLRDLHPGSIFRRESGDFRYIVTHEHTGDGGNEQIYCHNLDGNSDGYYHQGNERVVLLTPPPPPVQPRPPESTRPFWLCYVEGSGLPMVRHPSLQVAVAEAERLTKTTGRRVYLLCAHSSVTFIQPIPVERAVQWSSSSPGAR